jgi:hypothetical protein
MPIQLRPNEQPRNKGAIKKIGNNKIDDILLGTNTSDKLNTNFSNTFGSP